MERIQETARGWEVGGRMKKGKRVEKGEVAAADDEVSCRCSMILREYQEIAKRWGRGREEKGNGTRARREPRKNSLPLFILGRKSRTGSWERGAVVECGCCEGKEDHGDLIKRKWPGMGQLMLVVGMCSLRQYYYSSGGDSMMRACFDAQAHRTAGARDGTRNMTVFRRLGRIKSRGSWSLVE
jgi:hypothetical protein